MSSRIYISFSTIIPLNPLTGYDMVYRYIWERCGEMMQQEEDGEKIW